MPESSLVSPINESDFPEVAAFAARYARTGEPVSDEALSPEDRLRWVLGENPARSADIPFGWCTRDSGSKQMIAMLVCVPFRVGVGDFSCTALMASKFYADPNYPGAGIGPLMRFVQEGRRFPLLMTSANAVAGELYRKCGAYEIAGLDHTMLGVSRTGPLAEEWAFRRIGNGLASRILALPAHLLRRGFVRSRPSGELEALSSADQLATLSLPRPCEALAVIRDAQYLSWRYFGRERGKEVYRLRISGAEDRLVLVRLMRSGHRGQIRVLDVLDLWPPGDPHVVIPLVTQLALRYKNRFDAIWIRSQAAETEQAMRKIGFVRHQFPAPLGWCIDRAGLLPMKRWYLMPGETE